MTPQLTYFVLLTALSIVQGAASQLGKLETQGTPLLWLFAIVGLLSFVAAIVYGFFLLVWYAVLGLLLLAVVIDPILVHLRLAPQHPIARLVYGYAIAVVALVLHVVALKKA
jgi:hypothetical protein